LKIGLISDTHSYLDPKIFDYFKNCDEIWHAGDIGSLEVSDRLQAFKPFKAVFGNIDDPDIRHQYPENLRFNCEGFNIWMTHIGGAPPNYNPSVKKVFKENQPDIFICGHSHILRVISDKTRKNMIYLNPGAAGMQGFHKIRTLLRFELENKQIKNMEVIELGKRGIVNY
jgi:uncharacterized protein